MDPIRVLAPSGVAALNIHGRTLQSGFSLPLNGFSPLACSRLANMQLLWEGVYFAIIGERSMLSLRTLAQIDSRCRQLFPRNANLLFESSPRWRLCTIPSCWRYSLPSTENGCLSHDGSALYRLSNQSFRLRVVHRQGGDCPDQVVFQIFIFPCISGWINNGRMEAPRFSL